MEKFNLANYKEDILGVAKEHSVSAIEGLHLFVQNLVTMSEHYGGASCDINYHSLGQKWNSMLSTEKVKQKDSMISMLSMPSRGNSRSGKE